jgi:hypothetical protein
MKKLLLHRMFIAVSVIACLNSFSFSASAFSGAGTGTYGDPYQITSASQLWEVTNNLASSYKLMADIDLTTWIAANSATKGWVGIGYNTGAGTYFTGNFDGNGHAITGIWTNDTAWWRGLFGTVGGTVEIKNLGVVIASGKSIKSSQYVGGMVGSVVTGSLTISSCYVLGDVTANNSQFAGAFIGYNNNSTTALTNCYAGGGTITTVSEGAGGLIGYSYGPNCVTNITNCYTTNTVVGGTGAAAGFFETATDSGSGAAITISISNCVALNPSISGKSGSARIFVWQKGGTHTFTNNLAYDGTLVNGAVVTTGTATDNNGLNTTFSKLTVQATYSAWDFTNVWQMGNGSYPFPVLKNMSMVNQPNTRPAYLVGLSLATDYFRSKATGNWSNVATWESSTDNTNWITATLVPDVSAAAVTVLSGHTVTVDQIASAGLLTINSGARLTLNSGNTLTASTFNINSNAANGTGTFVDLNTGGGLTVSGTTSVQQYLTAGRNWYVSSPVSGATSNVFNAAASSNINKLYWYDETNGSSATLNWPQISVNSTSLSVGKGYIANVDASLLTSTNGVTFTGGSLNTGNISTGTNGVSALTSTSTSGAYQGYNLIGNPYPSYVNAMTAINNAGSAIIDPTIWYRTQASGAYYFETLNTTSGIGTNVAGTGTVTGYIPPMQAFWVHIASAPATLTFSNSMRAHAFNVPVGSGTVPTTPLKAPSNQNSLQHLLRLQVSNGTNSDEAIIYINPNASNGLDNYDSQKMSNNNPAIPEIYTTVENVKLVINGMNSITPDTEIPLGFTTGQSNGFSIKATEISNFDSNSNVYLKDNLLNTEQVLTDSTAYTFASDVASTTSRFSVVFKSIGVTTGVQAASSDQEVLIYKNANNQIAVNCKGSISDNAFLSVYNTLGQKLELIKIMSTTTISGKPFTSGVYVVTVNNDGKITTKKVILN